MTTTTKPKVITVAEYSARIVRALGTVGPALIEGEVQKPRVSGSGALWFSLTDGDAVLSCKVFGRQRHRLQHDPRDGDLVQVMVDRPDVWRQAGKLDLVVSDIRLAGEGELLRRRKELIGRLTHEGLCDTGRRRPLAAFPRAVGVISAAGSSGLGDFVRAFEDRWPAVHLVTCAALVQGKRAPAELIDALICLQRHPLVDVIVMGRGGGSVTDLAAFDDERLCRAVFACEKPVVCAVGHTEDVSVCDHVTWSAPTPSRAPELVVPSAVELRQEVRAAGAVLDGVSEDLAHTADRLADLAERLDLERALAARAEGVARDADHIQSAVASGLERRQAAVASGRGVLAMVPHRLPAVSTVRAAAAELDARALQLFTQRAGDIATHAGALARAGERLAYLHGQVGSEGGRVGRSVRRQLEDHERDFSRATGRLVRESATSTRRRLRLAGEDTAREGARLAERARSRLGDARRDLRHVNEVIAARDFRRRGWLLAAHQSGAAVRSATELTEGQRLALHLHDGRADAVVENVNPEQGRSSQ